MTEIQIPQSSSHAEPGRAAGGPEDSPRGRFKMRASSRNPVMSWCGIAAFGVIGLIAPSVFYGATDYGYNLMLSLVIWTGLAVSWNVFSGLTRYLSLGHAAFFGVGAYAVAKLHPVIGAWPSLIAACLVAGLVGLLLGVATLRLRGLFFTMATIGIAEVLRLGVLLTPDLTGGGTGLTLGGLPSFAQIYYVALGFLVVLMAVVLLSMSSIVGARLVAIQDDEEALGAVGVAVSRYKIISFSLSVMGAGFFGGVYALQIGFVQADAVFPLLISLTVVIMCMLGGMGTFWGPVAGAVVLSLLREELWARYPTIWDLGLGVVLIVIVIAMPGGLLGAVRQHVPALRKHLL
jgi:branched-chain amino acid transport system permease protein